MVLPIARLPQRLRERHQDLHRGGGNLESDSERTAAAQRSDDIDAPPLQGEFLEHSESSTSVVSQGRVIEGIVLCSNAIAAYQLCQTIHSTRFPLPGEQFYAQA
ncbi:MAG: hypothetical protein AAF420_06370 [Pseudomonadota bacterium]